jgi:hypothetical protein
MGTMELLDYSKPHILNLWLYAVYVYTFLPF